MKALILDAGGVLVYPANGNWLYTMGLIHSRFADQLGSAAWARANEAAKGFLDESRFVPDEAAELLARTQYFTTLCREMGWEVSDAEIAALAEDFVQNDARYAFYADVPEYLAKWKQKYRLGLLSDAMPSVLRVLKNKGVLQYFEQHAISTHVAALKPSPRMYRAILEKMGVRPEEALFVDDRPCNLEGAMRMGMRAVRMERENMELETGWSGPSVRNFEELDAYLCENFR